MGGTIARRQRLTQRREVFDAPQLRIAHRRREDARETWRPRHQRELT
jgi:hypothetical protein